jgi:dihydrofolate reductase
MISVPPRRQDSMTTVKSQLSVSVDGFVAGPNQSLENPIGEGGMALHQWLFAANSWREAHGLDGGEGGADSDVIEAGITGVGAYIMGRKMFGGGEGPWDETWAGWWGDDPPFHVPVFVMTHHRRPPLVLSDTTFTFVTDGIEAAVAQARAAAGDGDVMVAGGASVVQQCIRAGLLAELHLHVVPVILGSGERLLDDIGTPTFELLEVVASPTVTHGRYRTAH